MSKHPLLAATLSLLALSLSASGAPATAPKEPAEVCAADAGWDDPAVPRKIYGNTYYVGTCAISSILVTSGEGHILIDGGTEVGASLIEANIKTMGFRLEDVKILVISHEHWDHAGGIAKLQQDTGAKVYARKSAAATLERGKSDRSDPQFEVAEPMAKVAAVERLADGQTLKVGNIELRAHATPGHTPGSTTWTWRSCEGELCQNLAYVDSLTAISDDVYRYSDEKTNPGVLAAFQKTLEDIAALPCDIVLTPHPSASQMWQRIGKEAEQPLIDAEGCRNYAAKGKKGLDARIAKEKESEALPK